jgi:DNA-binding transcriptional LysR family regulator
MVEVFAADERSLAQLESGELDCALRGEPPDAPFLSRELFRERFIGVLCARHPLAIKARQSPITLDDYLAFTHVMVTFRDPRLSPVDAKLAEVGRSRKIAIEPPALRATSLRFAGRISSCRSPRASRAARKRPVSSCSTCLSTCRIIRIRSSGILEPRQSRLAVHHRRRA